MSWIAPLLAGNFVLFTLVLARVGGLVMLAPVYGGQSMPAKFRALLAFALALLVAPTQLGANVAPPQSLLGYGVALGGEWLVGMVLGLGVAILFYGLQLAGQVIGQLSGLSLAEVFDPDTDASVPVVSQLLYVFALAVFVLIGGHRLVMEGLLTSFTSLPPGQGGATGSLLETVTTLAGDSFTLGIRVAAPTMVALLVATLAMGLVSRALPQLNTMTFGFGVTAVVMFTTLAVSLGTTALVFEDQLAPTLNRVLEALR